MSTGHIHSSSSRIGSSQRSCSRTARASTGTTGARGELVENELLDDLAAAVVALAATAGLLDDPARLIDGEAQPVDAEPDRDVLTQRALTIVDRLGQHLHHAKVALDGRGRFVVEAIDAHTRPEQVAEHGDLDAGFAERRQHLLDVGEEEPVGTDDQHTLTLEREAMRVEEIGGTVQRNDRLAGAGAALHEQHARHRGTDDLVLLALDGGDDVAESTGAARFDGRDQRSLASHFAFARRIGQFAEEFVVDTEQGAAAGGEVTPALDTHRFATGGPVEGFGHGSSPVDDDGILLSVPDAHPADVELLTRSLGVDPTEHQRTIAEVELRQPLNCGLDDGLPLVTVLFGATSLRLVARRDLARARPSLFEAGVGPIEPPLLCIEFGMSLRHSCHFAT